MDPPEGIGYHVFNDTIFSDFRRFVNPQLHEGKEKARVAGFFFRASYLLLDQPGFDLL
jgi:hypothetical protein